MSETEQLQQLIEQKMQELPPNDRAKLLEISQRYEFICKKTTQALKMRLELNKKKILLLTQLQKGMNFHYNDNARLRGDPIREEFYAVIKKELELNVIMRKGIVEARKFFEEEGLAYAKRAGIFGGKMKKNIKRMLELYQDGEDYMQDMEIKAKNMEDYVLATSWGDFKKFLDRFYGLYENERAIRKKIANKYTPRHIAKIEGFFYYWLTQPKENQVNLLKTSWMGIKIGAPIGLITGDVENFKNIFLGVLVLAIMSVTFLHLSESWANAEQEMYDLKLDTLQRSRNVFA